MSTAVFSRLASRARQSLKGLMTTSTTTTTTRNHRHFGGVSTRTLSFLGSNSTQSTLVAKNVQSQSAKEGWNSRFFFSNHRACFSASATDNVDPETQAEIDDANERYKGRIIIQCTGSHGWGLYSEKDWKKGDLVMTAFPKKTTHVDDEKDSHTIQYDTDKHATIDLPGRYINHVCGTANCGIKIITDAEKHEVIFEFYALRDIPCGEELQWDYETTEYDMIAKFDCLCGSPVCRKRLTGFHHHADQVIEAYGEQWVAPYLLEMRRREQEKSI